MMSSPTLSFTPTTDITPEPIVVETPHDVLTDVPGKPGRFWDSHTTCVGPSDPPHWLRHILGKRLSYNLIRVIAALRLFAGRRHYQGVVTGGGANGLLFAWLQALCPWGRRCHVMVDCNWNPPKGRFRRWLKGLRIRWAARSVHRFVVWASHEIEDYAATFGIPKEKIVYVPFHDTIRNYEFDIRDDGYLFAGGNFDRDYPTLIEAVRETDVATWIATTRHQQLDGVDIPENVRVEGTTPEDFRQAIAGANMVVVPMRAGLLHSGGQQTCLNAMLLAKPTIAVGRKWAVDFIDDGVDGLIVDYEDPQGLRRAIVWVREHPEEARAMGLRAQRRAAQYTTHRTMETIYRLVTEAD